MNQCRSWQSAEKILVNLFKLCHTKLSWYHKSEWGIHNCRLRLFSWVLKIIRLHFDIIFKFHLKIAPSNIRDTNFQNILFNNSRCFKGGELDHQGFANQNNSLGSIAQLGERKTEDLKVMGSIPIVPTFYFFYFIRKQMIHFYPQSGSVIIYNLQNFLQGITIESTVDLIFVFECSILGSNLGFFLQFLTAIVYALKSNSISFSFSVIINYRNSSFGSIFNFC